jgi:hypothetical protein
VLMSTGMAQHSERYLTRAGQLLFGIRFLVAVGLLATPCVFAAEVQTPAPAAHSSADLRRQGKLLRAEIDAKFDKLTSSDNLGAGVDVTAIVTKYVPPGISFDDAKQMLQAAGLSGGLTVDGKFFFRVFLGGWFFKDTIFGVFLIPSSPGDFSVVQAVRGSLFVT